MAINYLLGAWFPKGVKMEAASELKILIINELEPHLICASTGKNGLQTFQENDNIEP